MNSDTAALVVDDDADALDDNGAAPDDSMEWNDISAPNDRDIVVDQRALAAQASEHDDYNVEPLMRLSPGRLVENMTERQFFEHFLPKTWIQRTMIPAMNATARSTMDAGSSVRYNDLLVVLGVLMYHAAQVMSTFRDMWSTATHHVFRPVPHPIRKFISRDKCERIMRLFGCLPPTEREDDTHPLKGLLALIAAFNERWKACFRPSFAVCMDESTSATTAKHDCARVRCYVACADVALCVPRCGASYLQW